MRSAAEVLPVATMRLNANGCFLGKEVMEFDDDDVVENDFNLVVD